MESRDLANLGIDALRHRLSLREGQLKAVHNISAALFSRGDLDELLRDSLCVLLQTVNADAGSILLYDKEKRKLVFRYVIGTAASKLTGGEIDPEDPVGKAAAV